MSNLSDLNDISDNDANAMELFGAAIGTIADFARGIGSIIILINQMNMNLGPDGEAVQNATLNKILQVLHAQDLIMQLGKLDDQLSKPLSVLEALPALSAANLMPGDVASNIEICSNPINYFIDPMLAPIGIWDQPYADQVYWNDWPDHIYAGNPAFDIDVGYDLVAPAPEPGGLVFTHTYVLPTFLRALAIWLTVAVALDEDFVAHYGTTLLEPAITALRYYHDKIVNEGIVSLAPMPVLRSPTSTTSSPWNADFLLAQALNLQNTDDPQTLLANMLQGITPLHTLVNTNVPAGVTIEYGAVDKFSGASAMGPPYKLHFYFSPDWNQVSFSPESIGPASGSDMSAYKKFQVRLLKKSMDLYSKLDLLDAWKSINNIRSILRMPPLDGPGFANWSFRAISNIVGLTSLKAIMTFIVSTPPLDTPPVTDLFLIGFRPLLEPY